MRTGRPGRTDKKENYCDCGVSYMNHERCFDCTSLIHSKEPFCTYCMDIRQKNNIPDSEKRLGGPVNVPCGCMDPLPEIDTGKITKIIEESFPDKIWVLKYRFETKVLCRKHSRLLRILKDKKAQ